MNLWRTLLEGRLKGDQGVAVDFLCTILCYIEIFYHKSLSSVLWARKKTKTEMQTEKKLNHTVAVYCIHYGWNMTLRTSVNADCGANRNSDPYEYAFALP